MALQDFKRIDEAIYEIPKERGMLVPGKVFGTEKIISALESEAIQQIKNTAYLPGIQKFSIAMPDAHLGYGLVIGGVAAFDLKEGIVSPGGIGFDINCLHGSTKVLTEHGEIKIKKFDWQKVATLCNKKIEFVKPCFFMSKKARIAKLETELGNRVKSSIDHPFLTKDGMIELKKLKENNEIAIVQNGKISWEKISKIKDTGFVESVYDFTIPKTHNFIANNFLVSNCGVRLIKTNLTEKEVRPKLKELIDECFRTIPAGVGGKAKVRLSNSDLKEVLELGAKWAVEKGFGWKEDLQHIEEQGSMKNARAERVSLKAMQRGLPQCGTLGSGNHFIEIQKVSEVFDESVAKVFGLHAGQIVVMEHSGSRGLGHQVATDYLDEMVKAMQKYKIKVPDRQLACAPIQSIEGQHYLQAMWAAVNYSFANRQMMMHWIREAFAKFFGKSAEELEMHLLYDIAHNIAKIEEHEIEGKRVKVLVHRKGATRAFPVGRPENPTAFAETGHPAIIPGSMGTASFVMVGTEKGLQESFGSICHGAGRRLSRHAALREKKGEQVKQELEAKGEIVRAKFLRGLAEEADFAYKPIADVIESVELAGIGRKIAKMKPLAVMKG